MFELKPISKPAVPAALRKAERYRLLNEPLEAESICRDVLEVEPDNQEALVTLVLALSDQLGEKSDVHAEAKRRVAALADPYARSYYGGILCERQAKAALGRGGPGSGRVAYQWLREAMERFGEAIDLCPPGNDDAVLRWNTCVRLLGSARGIEPPLEEPVEQMLE